MLGPIDFVRWRSAAPSGGNRYDDALVRALRALGARVHEIEVSGSSELESALARATAPSILVDNIVGSAAPGALRRAALRGQWIALLVHFFPADEEGTPAPERERLERREGQAVAVASRVIATSEWTARAIERRYGRADAVIAIPGVESVRTLSESREHDGPPALLWLGRITHTKDPLTFVEALAELGDVAWRARIVGAAVDTELDRALRARIATAGLADRIEVLGARVGDALEAMWCNTGLLVHTARTEAYGMVVAEALAHGIPSIVARGTGAVEAQQGAGGAFTPGDAVALAAQLRDWLEDAQLRERWRDATRARTSALPTWEQAARAVIAAFER